MSSRRLVRLRRTAATLVLLLLFAGGAAGYAAWRGGVDQASATSQQPPVDGRPPGPAATGSRENTGRAGFAPVVTDRIPAPTKSIALTAPVPGTTNMQPAAAAAFKAAFAAARTAGLSPQIRSAWRSERYQQILFDRAVTKYGSRAEAAKWVLPPLASAHVKGYAVDVRPENVAAWLEDHGGEYGVCRAYDNEWWHFEYVADSTCPPRKPDAAG